MVLGIGDDACLLELLPGYQLVVSTDTQVVGTHFWADQPPITIGHRALATALSDLAAMGADPLGFVLALTLPDHNPGWVQQCARGVRGLAEQMSIPWVGGDTTRGPLSLTVTVMGQVPAGQALRRSGARVGDWLVVSGELGGAAAALWLEQQRRAVGAEPTPAEDPLLERLFWPQPRMRLGQCLRGRAHAAIDLSDGLLADLGHICRASGCGAHLNAEAIPIDWRLADWSRTERLRAALSHGDDYELLFAWPEAARHELADLAVAAGVSLTVIGQCVAAQGIVVTGAESSITDQPGFDHFAAVSNCEGLKWGQ